MGKELIVFAGASDWANVCHGWARALNDHSARFRARCVVEHAHRFAYAQDITLDVDGETRIAEVRAVFDEARVLVHSGDGDYASWERLARLGLDTNARTLATVHAGSAYRNEPRRFDALDREVGFALRLITPDCVRFCDADPLVRAALPVAPIGEPPRRDDPVVLCHSPSRRATKGTATIARVVEALPAVESSAVEWRLIEGVPHDECMRRKRGATIFIDQVQPRIGGFGVAALEAMGAGAVCLASLDHVSTSVDRFWSRPPIVDVRSPAALDRALRELLDDPERLFALRCESYRWAREVAAAEPCARRLEAWFGEAVDSLPARPRARMYSFAPAPEVSCAVIARVDDGVALASLKAAIRSVEPLADECVVVLDDRSRDDVRAALEDAGARVVMRAWTDDFAAARTAAQDACRGDWIFVIDGDEVLADVGDVHEALALAKEREFDAVSITVRTMGDRGAELDILQARLYRRERCHWRHAVHNELVGARLAIGSTARIDASYAGTSDEKIARSLPLMLAHAEREPNEARWAHYIARAYYAARDMPAHDRWARRCLELAPAEPAFAQTWVDLTLARLGGGETGERGAIAAVIEGLAHQPNEPDLWHTLAVVSLVEWYRLSHGPPRPISRTTRFAENLPAVASALGLPISFGNDAD